MFSLTFFQNPFLELLGIRFVCVFPVMLNKSRCFIHVSKGFTKSKGNTDLPCWGKSRSTICRIGGLVPGKPAETPNPRPGLSNEMCTMYDINCCKTARAFYPRR